MILVTGGAGYVGAHVQNPDKYFNKEAETWQ